MKVSQLFSPILVLSLSHLAVTQPSASDSTIANDILAIDAAVRNLTATLAKYQGGIREAGPSVSSILEIHAVNRQGFADAKASPQLSQSQSARVTDVTRNSVGKSIPEAIALTKTKKPLFDQAELSSVVRSTLALLQYDHDSFSLAVGSKLDPTNVAPAGVAAAKIAAAIADGMLYYAV